MDADLVGLMTCFVAARKRNTIVTPPGSKCQLRLELSTAARRAYGLPANNT